MADLLQPPRVHYTEEHGWLIDTTIQGGFKPEEIARIVVYVMNDWRKRLPRMAPGDKRDRALLALSKLDVRTIRQRVLRKYSWEHDTIICSDRS